MIEDAEKSEVLLPGDSSQSPQRVFFRLQARRLSAIEIAEGALLADIAVIFQLLVRYLPVGGSVLQMLVPVIFTIIVLRRGLYTGCMSLCVALFIICIVMGPGGMPFLLLESGAGLFLGTTMRLRRGHFVTITVGILCGSLALWAVLALFLFLYSGTAALLRSMQRTYTTVTSILGLVCRFIGLQGFWLHTLLPLLNNFMQWGLQHWLLLFYLGCVVACIPLVIGVYFICNFFLRVLGYTVRPFPGYRLEGLLYWLLRQLFRLVPRRAFARFSGLRNLRREVRRLNMARFRQHRLEKEARRAI